MKVLNELAEKYAAGHDAKGPIINAYKAGFLMARKMAVSKCIEVHNSFEIGQEAEIPLAIEAQLGMLGEDE